MRGSKKRFGLTYAGWVALGIVLSVFLLSGGLFHSNASAMRESRNRGSSTGGKIPKDVEDFPLWMSVPSKAFAVLGEGVVRQTRWALYVYRGRGKEGAERPCLDLATIYFGVGEGESFRNGTACGPLAPPAKRIVTTKADLQVQKKIDGPIVGSSVLGMAVGSHVATLEVELDPDGKVVGKTRYLSARQAAKAHVRRFRYFTLARAKKICLDAVEGFSFNAEKVLDYEFADECS